MPRVRRRGHSLRGELTPEQVWCLVIGTEKAAFAKHEDYERAWWFHRNDLLESVNPTFRPHAWWALEFRGERKPGERDWEALERHGLLTPFELHLVEKWGLRQAPTKVAAI